MYLDVLGVLNFAVDFLLLRAADRLSGYSGAVGRTVLAALLGGVYACVCVLPGWGFLASAFWRLVCLGMMGWIAFGFCRNALRRSVLFVLLSMALGGAAIGLASGGFISIVMTAVGICLMCFYGLRGKIGKRFLPVKICHGDCCVRFTAMLDTGNTLADPVTGKSVLVVSSHIAPQLLEISEKELADPVKALNSVKGGRLIPYHAVGTDNGLLLAKYFRDVTVGDQKGGRLVAFAPGVLGKGEGYEALTGGDL